MKKRNIFIAFFVAVTMLTAMQTKACTNFLFTKGATKDGSTMITYAADSHTLYGELYYTRAAQYAAGTMIQVIEWDTGKPLIKIPQVAQTYTTVGNMNEWGLTIGETTYGGREECWDLGNGIDYGSLIYLTLQRAKTAREAIKTIAEFMATYGYASEGESFSIADGDEVWIMELIGKGKPVMDTIKDKKGNVKSIKANKKWTKGGVWVARRIPDGYVCGHANQARITTFPWQKKGSFVSISSKNLKEIRDTNDDIIVLKDTVLVD